MGGAVVLVCHGVVGGWSCSVVMSWCGWWVEL